MNNKRRLYALIGIFTCIIFICAIALKNDDNKKVIKTSSASLSNKKIGWGIKRNDNHEQPDLGMENKKLIDTYERNSNGK